MILTRRCSDPREDNFRDLVSHANYTTNWNCSHHRGVLLFPRYKLYFPYVVKSCKVSTVKICAWRDADTFFRASTLTSIDNETDKQNEQTSKHYCMNEL